MMERVNVSKYCITGSGKHHVFRNVSLRLPHTPCGLRQQRRQDQLATTP